MKRNEDQLTDLKTKSNKISSLFAEEGSAHWDDLSSHLFLNFYSKESFTYTMKLEAKSYLRQQLMASSIATTVDPKSVEEIRKLLKERGTKLLPLALKEAFDSPRMPQAYREVLVGKYDDNIRPPRSSAVAKQCSRAELRLMEIHNFPQSWTPVSLEQHQAENPDFDIPEPVSVGVSKSHAEWLEDCDADLWDE